MPSSASIDLLSCGGQMAQWLWVASIFSIRYGPARALIGPQRYLFRTAIEYLDIQLGFLPYPIVMPSESKYDPRKKTP